MSARFLIRAGVLVAVAGLVVGGVLWPGLDARRAAGTDVSVWALQSGEGQRYARVNTELGELDTVRQVHNATGVTQAGGAAYLLADGVGRLVRIDASSPADLDSDALEEAPATPTGTVDVARAGDFVAFRSDAGTVSYGHPGSLGALNQLRDPEATGADAAPFSADAVSLDDRGVLTAYAGRTGRVLRYDIAAATLLSLDRVADAPTGSGLQVSAVGDHWVLLAGDGRRAWVSGVAAPVLLPTNGAVQLQRATADGALVALADSRGLVSIDVRGVASRLYLASASLGIPAAPVVVDGALTAAWLPPDGAGTLWRDGVSSELDYAGRKLAEDAVPQFQLGSDRAILNETRSGWVWTLPDGRLVPSSQDWSLAEPQQQDSSEQGSRTEVVLDPRPPVAQDDRFGVRAGELVSLPVLLNDHDPNTDVLTIDPTRVSGLDPGFGRLTLTDNDQRLAVRVAAGARGSATFTYRVTDGTAAAGRYSDLATVTLTVAAGTAEEAPVWCPGDCLASWPQAEVAPGGTVTVPVLTGWVDPDGDPLLVLGARSTSRSVSVAATPEGDVVVQHHDASATEAEKVAVEVTVADTRGGTATRQLTVRVTGRPALAAESFATTQATGEPRSISLAGHVTGTAATLELSEVRVHGDGTAAVVTGSLAFTFSSGEAGTRIIDYTITDGSTRATAQVRVTLTDGTTAGLATAPVLAFVRPSEDATLDVLAPVDNPTGRVLLLSTVTSTAEDGATLTVDVVGQSSLRVLGTTADGAPGRLGTVDYTVSDGEGAQVRGQATVYLLPPAARVAPIAVDDTVTVRAGAQLDIPVTANDIAPSGSTVTLDPRSVRSTEPSALAFASVNLVRTLAPATPGSYRITYSVFAYGSPDLAADATVHVTVLAGEENRAPRPGTLTGRVLSGESVEIGFDDLGIDPDGDAVRLDRVLTQPARGSAAVSADGRSIVYTSVAGDEGGQVAFGYRVLDSRGATGEGTVRVGVLDEQASPAPVTYTDDVQVQAGAANSVRVAAAANDIDPTGGTLRITGVQPNVPRTLADGSANPDFARLLALLGERTDSDVVISAGEAPGTLSYRYDVESSSGNTGTGLIVVKVVTKEVPNFPVVSDTVLTAETRPQFAAGVDVVTGRASWPGGEVSRLRLSLWDGAGAVTDATADGWSVSGEAPERTRTIPLQFTATGADGTPLTTSDGSVIATWAFLVVPGAKDVQLTLRSGREPREVAEDESVRFDMADLVALPGPGALQVGDDGPAASGARRNASCRPVSGTVVEYRAGRGAPWTDSCYVPVRLQGQDSWTVLAVPIRVTPAAPQPSLGPASVTLSPGEDTSYDLARMTSWDGASDQAAVTYTAATGGVDLFDVALKGQRISITAHDDAIPGRDERVLIRITSHDGVRPAALTVRVGPAPSQLPQGGTAGEQCSQAKGGSCEVRVVGAPGEVNPLPRTPLVLIDVRSGGDCPGVSYTVASATTVRVSWAEGTPGGSCTATFSVRDAQRRTTAGDRDGHLAVDLLGYPEAPDSASQVAFSTASVTLRVKPGAARNAYPELKGFIVRRGGDRVGSCDAAGVCDPITAPIGDRRSYQVSAYNAVGESKAAVSVDAWAYGSPPSPDGATAVPVVTSSGRGEVVALAITGIDAAQTDRLRISSDAGGSTTVSVGRDQSTVELPAFEVGSNSRTRITITPVSRYNSPPDLGGSGDPNSITVYGNGVGAPQDLVLDLSSTVAPGATTADLTANGSASANGDGSELRYGFARAGQPCQPTGTATSQVFSGVRAGDAYDITLCAASVYNGQVYGTSEVTRTVRAVQEPAAPGGYRFVVNASAAGSSAHPQWLVTADPTSAEQPPYRNKAVFDEPSGRFGPDFASGFRVRYCHEQWTDECGAWGVVAANADAAAGPVAPYQVQVTGLGLGSCTGGRVPTSAGESTGGKATITADASNADYWVPDASGGGSWQAAGSDGTAPATATKVRNLALRVAWPAAWGLTAYTTTTWGDCDPTATPTPTAAPTPTADPTDTP
ncbi:Ig-like domain-containing protein [Propionicimonas sp.]|uniref:Ig-like domain-containing protein n=1 Tax=Propionicimonas sp. TaxID=1955623 RepID=UPI0039E5E8D8